MYPTDGGGDTLVEREFYKFLLLCIVCSHIALLIMILRVIFRIQIERWN